MKKNIVLIISIILLVIIEVYLSLYLTLEAEIFVVKYEIKDYLCLGYFFSFLFTNYKRLGLLLIAAYQIVIGSIYFSHLPGIGNLILMLLHLIIAPLIFFHSWIEEKIKIKK